MKKKGRILVAIVFMLFVCAIVGDRVVVSQANSSAMKSNKIGLIKLFYLDLRSKIFGPILYSPYMATSGTNYVATTDGKKLLIYEIDGLNVLFIEPRPTVGLNARIEIIDVNKNKMFIKYNEQIKEAVWEFKELLFLFKAQEPVNADPPQKSSGNDGNHEVQEGEEGK
jgi:hypothetical protein